jgi:uncharacterized protein (TIGR03067 family)
MWCCSLLILLAPLAAGDGTPSEDTLKKELQQFQGSWKAVSMQHADGQQASDDDVQKTRLVVKDNRFTLTGKDYTVEGSFKVNPATTPKSIDVLVISKDGRETKFLGIYEIKGNTRKSCFALGENDRPTRFSTQKGYFGFEWKRD